MNDQNLIPLHKRAKSEQREIRRKGAIASHKVQKEKKLLSQIYAELLAKQHDITINGESKKVVGSKLCQEVAMKVLSKGDSSSVSMLKEIREATEGNKIINSGEIDSKVTIKFE